MTHRLDNLLADLRDTNQAIRRAKAGKVVHLCVCGCITVETMCPKCKRKIRKEKHERRT